MTYSIIGILAGIILVITNRDVLWLSGSPESSQILRKYRSFLFAVLAYYITDALWGILDAHRLTTLQFLDTTLYFAAMAVLVLLWTRYVIAYLEGNTSFDTALGMEDGLFSDLNSSSSYRICFIPSCSGSMNRAHTIRRFCGIPLFMCRY